MRFSPTLHRRAPDAPRRSSRVPAAALALLLALPGSTRAGDLFGPTEPLPIELEAPWQALLAERDRRPEVAATLHLRDAAGGSLELAARLSVRGKWRLENCDLPPLTLELEPREIAQTPLAGHPKVHLTPQCHRHVRFRDCLVREFLAYRIYRLLTDAALGSRLLAVRYREAAGGPAPAAGLAVLVEDLGAAAGRLEARWLDEEKADFEALDPSASVRFALFQYLIGNVDWSFLRGPEGERCCHNAALLAPLGSAPGLVPVPYDFDASGLVDTGETEPPPELGLSSTRERRYRGLCPHNAHLPEAIDSVLSARPEIDRLLASAGLPPKAVRRTAAYLEPFWTTVADPRKVEKRIASRCRPPVGAGDRR